MKSDWLKYWEYSTAICMDETAEYKHYKLWQEFIAGAEEKLDFYIDKRTGRTQGVIFFYAPCGSLGSKMATAEEAVFLEGKINEHTA